MNIGPRQGSWRFSIPKAFFFRAVESVRHSIKEAGVILKAWLLVFRISVRDIHYKSICKSLTTEVPDGPTSRPKLEWARSVAYYVNTLASPVKAIFSRALYTNR